MGRQGLVDGTPSTAEEWALLTFVQSPLRWINAFREWISVAPGRGESSLRMYCPPLSCSEDDTESLSHSVEVQFPSMSGVVAAA